MVFALTGRAAPGDKDKPAEKPDVDKLNKKIDAFTLEDADGKTVRPRRPQGQEGRRRRLPVVRLPRLQQLRPDARSSCTRRTPTRASPSSASTPATTSAPPSSPSRPRSTSCPSPCCKDDEFKAADAFKAEDRARGVRPRPQPRPALPRPDRQRLLRPAQEEPADHRATTCKNALDDLLAGKAVRDAGDEGGRLPHPARATSRRSDGKVTYHRDVLPILQNHCQECHRPGEVGPFSLMTYKQAVNWAERHQGLHADAQDAAVEAGRGRRRSTTSAG